MEPGGCTTYFPTKGGAAEEPAESSKSQGNVNMKRKGFFTIKKMKSVFLEWK